MKTFAYIVSGVLALLILVVVVAPFLLDLNDYKGDIAAAVKDATGRDLAIDGDIAVSLVPLPTIRVAGMRFANLDGATAPDMVRIGVVEASVALMPLLSGDIEVSSLTFVNPVIELEVLDDGRANWRLGTPGGEAAGGSASLALRIDSLVVKGATLTYRNGVAGTVERVENLNLEAAVGSLNGPFRATGSLVARSTSRAIPLAFEVQIGALDQRPLPLRVNLSLSDADTTLTFNGSASSASPDAEVSGRLKVKGESLARLINAFSGGGGNTANPLLAHAFSLDASVAASTVTAGVNDVVFDLGGVQGTGAVSALLADDPQVDVAIALNHVDLDKLLASAATPEPAGSSDGGSVARPFSLPGEIYATLDLRVDAVVYNQSVVRQAALVASLDQGVVTVQHASALLPGGSDVTVFGVLDFPDGRHHFDGQFEASADNLRTVFDWLDITPTGVPADRLRKLSLSSRVEVTPTLAKVSAIDLRVDSSRLTGAVNIGLGPRLGFNAIITLDQINLDAYMAPAAADDPGGGEGDDPLAVFGEFDAELKAKVGRLVYNGLPLSDITLDAGLRRGVLSIRALRIDDLAGAGATLAGTIDLAAPGFDVTYSVNAADAARLFQLANVAPPGGNLGGVVIHGSAKGNVAAVTLDTTVTLSDAEARFAGTLDGLAGTPRVDATISLRADSLALLARRFGVSLPDTAAHTPIALDGTVKGDVDAATVALTAAALGADLRLDGRLATLLDTPTYDLAVNLNHPDFVAFSESLGDDIRFARRDLGKVQISATIAGDSVAARINDLDAELGPSRLGGTMMVRFDGAKPSIDADITAGEIHTDLFQVVASTTGTGDSNLSAASGATGTTAGRWSRQPIDFSGLSAVDATARVSARALIFRKYRFEEGALRLTLAGGVLDIEELSGRLYGAPAKLRARFTDTSPPTAALALTLQGADLEAVLIDAAEIDAASGKLDLTARFQTQGRSEQELVSALGGEGSVAVRQGLIKGINLGRLNTQLANIDNEIALVGLIGDALSGGVTPIHSLDGTFSASNGVIRSTDFRAVLDGGEGSAVTTVDLPRWQLSMNSEFRLTGHPNAPPIGLLLMGPIDNPQREIRDKALKAHITEKVFGTVARKLAPAVTGQSGVVDGLLEALAGSGQAPQETAPAEGDPIPPPEASPENLFENLLQGIIQGN